MYSAIGFYIMPHNISAVVDTNGTAVSTSQGAEIMHDSIFIQKGAGLAIAYPGKSDNFTFIIYIESN
jgi:hypothetical protein